MLAFWILPFRGWQPSVHQPWALMWDSWKRKTLAPNNRVEELASRFEETPGAPGTDYDESLLRDLDRLATRVCWKYSCLTLADLGNVGGLGVGVAAFILRLWSKSH